MARDSSLPAVYFEDPGPDTTVLDDGRIVRKTDTSRSYSLCAPVLHRFSDNPASFKPHTGPPTARASATFQLDFDVSDTVNVFGVFPVDLDLDSKLESKSGQRAALMVWAFRDGSAQLLAAGKIVSVICHGAKSDRFYDVRWKKHDTIEVVVEFPEEGKAARVTVRFKGKAETVELDVAPLGWRFGVGLYSEGNGVTLIESSVEAPPPPRSKPKVEEPAAEEAAAPAPATSEAGSDAEEEVAAAGWGSKPAAAGSASDASDESGSEASDASEDDAAVAGCEVSLPGPAPDA
jgi:hypothetical protein